MHRIFLLVFATFIFFNGLSGQNKSEYFKNLPGISDDTPAWAKLMYSEDPDVREVERLYTEFYKNNPYEKNLDARNYKFWFRKIADYVDENGKIRPPSAKQENAKWEFLKQKRANQAQNSTQEKTPGTWVNLGPSETYTADGNQTPVSWQTNVYSLDQSKSNPTVLYAGTESGGVFKTTDRGVNWSLVSANEVFAGGILATRIHPTDPNIVYVGTNNRIYKTTDGGTTWNEMFNVGTTPQRLFMHQSNPDTVFCASNNGFHRSYDAGATWNQVFTEGCYDIESHPTDHDTLYLTKNDDTEKRSELFRTLDGGATWTQMTNGWYSPAVLAEARDGGSRIAVTPINPDYVYVALLGESKKGDLTDGDKGWIGIYQSTDAGATWSNPNAPDGGLTHTNSMGQDSVYYTVDHPNLATQNWAGTSFTQGFYNFGFAASHTTSGRLWVGNLSWYETSNDGADWEGLGGYASGSRHSWAHPDVQDVLVLGSDIWYATDGGIDYSNDEMQTKVSRKKGITAVDYWGFGSGWNEDVLVGGRYHNGNSGYIPAYGSGNHLRLGGAESPTGHVDPLKERTAYFNDISTAKIPTALNQPVIYSPKLGMYPTTHYWESYSSELEFDPRYAGHMYIGNTDGFWKSTDGGANFTRLYQFASDSRVEEIEICRSNPDVIYAAVKAPNGGYWNWSNIFKSTDGGETFNQLPDPTTSNRRGINLAHDPVNADNLWISIVGGDNGAKVYKTTDGGSTWVNKTTGTLDGESIKDIQYVGGATASVYIVTNVNAYYFDENTSDWVAYNTDLPFQTRALRMRPFFRDGKIRLASGRGILETEFFDEPAPVAQPMTFVDSVFCSRDTVELDCYSILNHSGASWNWTITPAPQYISSNSVRNPKVVLGTDGNYNVTLAVTDGNGATDSKTINNMIVVKSTCEPDSTAGNALKTIADGDKFVSQGSDLQNITNFTVTAWIKPNAGNQNIAAGIVSDGEWCFHCTNRHGFVYNYNGNRLWYAWPGNESSWASNSGLDPLEEEWNYVALVIYPDSAIMYLNEERYVDIRALSPGNIYNLNVGFGHYSRSFQGEMDEVTVWDRSLTRDEIREMRHLTKSGAALSDPNLVAYYQFTELVGGTQMMDMGGTNHGTLSGTASLTKSNVPIGKGTAHRLQVNDSNFIYDFSNAGAKLFLDDCEPATGEMVVSRLKISPYTTPNTNDNGNNYWLINYYGDNSNKYSFLDSVELTPSEPSFTTGLSEVSDAVLHIRNVHDTTQTWTSTAFAKNNNSGTLAFNRAVSIDTSIQIVLTNIAAAFTENLPLDYCELDTIPGMALKVPNHGDYIKSTGVNLTNVTHFTTTAWIRPDSLAAFGGVVSSGDWCAHCDYTEGLIIDYFGTRLWYKWPGNSGNWGSNSGMYVPVDEWSYVALVITPDSAVMYLNEDKYVHNISLNPGDIQDLYIGYGHYSKSLTGLIDEVTIWNRELSPDEIREMRHLTKEGNVPTDPNLIGYFQFNEAVDGNRIFDKKGNYHGELIGGAVLELSGAPVGSGVSEEQTVNSGGAVSFSQTGVTLGFPSTGTYPDGKIVTTRLNIPPNEIPNGGNQVVSDKYWIINNYGNNSTFSTLDSITFFDVKTINAVHEDSTHLFDLYKRSSNESLNNWTLEDGADFIKASGNDKGKISYSSGNGQTGFSQYAITDVRGVRLSAKAMLEGAYSGSLMTDSLRVQNFLPENEPYLTLGFNHQAGGGEEQAAANVFSPSGNDAVIDWVMVELRDKNNSSNVLYTRSALIQADGDIVDTDGISPVYFRQAGPGDYFVAIRHRNHLGVMALNALSLSSSTTVVDFTSVATYGTNAQKDLGSGVMGLWSADVNHDGVVNSDDLTAGWTNRNQLNYHPADTNFDGKTDAKDRRKIWNGRGVIEQLP